ncbi:hypothetical protein [Paucidesulfovibrio longus]|uniref:hypothetical protein n=1 Tax=Paucidesulfovibrio longus TaxID=889 RepID=UPI0003B50C0D|nr:hypothetical protein [Paucidesulfovibrio longus]
MTRPHPLLLTAALLAVLCAAAAAHAQDGDAPASWTALFGVHSATCSGGDLPEEQRRQFMALLVQHQQRLGELGRQLYSRQLEYDALSDTGEEEKPGQLKELQKEMQQLRKVMVDEDNTFAQAARKRFGLNISGGLHCAASSDISANK